MNAAVIHPIRSDLASPETTSTDQPSVFAAAHSRGEALGLTYAGRVSAADAWQLHLAGAAVILDVRTNEERKFVGYVPDTQHVPWQTGTSLNKNPRFVREVENKTGKDAVVLLLCRSGKRSNDAATALAAAGFANVYNIDEGFEGDLDDRSQRGQLGGWRHHGLPWIQD